MSPDVPEHVPDETPVGEKGNDRKSCYGVHVGAKLGRYRNSNNQYDDLGCIEGQG